MISEDILAYCIGGRSKHCGRRLIICQWHEAFVKLIFFCKHPQSVDRYLACQMSFVVYICYAHIKYVHAHKIRETTGHANQSTLTQLWWEQGSTFLCSWPSDVTALWVETRRTGRFGEIEPDDRRSKTCYHERCRSDHRRVLKPPEHLQGKWSLLGCLGLAVFRAPWLVWFMCLRRRPC